MTIRPAYASVPSSFIEGALFGAAYGVVAASPVAPLATLFAVAKVAHEIFFQVLKKLQGNSNISIPVLYVTTLAIATIVTGAVGVHFGLLAAPGCLMLGICVSAYCLITIDPYPA